MSRISNVLLLCLLGLPAFAAEDLRGNLSFVYPPDVTLYGHVADVNNLASNAFLVKACWDDPTFTSNCAAPIVANVSSSPLQSCTAPCTGFQYAIPTGTVGGITPRDGNPHLIYLKVISKTNPGPGDKAIDGSPWPFTFTNGVVGRMWKPNLEVSPSRLTPAQLAILVNGNDPYSIGSAGSIVCTVGGQRVRDDGVAGYYALRHNIPCSNLVVISIPVVQNASAQTFFSIIAPAVQALPASIQAVAIAWVQPSLVSFNVAGQGAQSISAVVANGGPVSGTGCPDGSNILGQGPVNPYFNSNSKAPYTDHRIRPAMMLAGEICPSCTATNNYSFAWQADFPTARAVIDSAIAGTDTNPRGNVYWSLTSDLKRSQTTLLVSPLELSAGLSPYADAQILGTLSSPTSFNVSARNILLYEESAPTWNYAAPAFIPGAGIGYAATSFSGWLPTGGAQTNAASWLSQGAIGAYGNAAEPCELLAYKHPDPALVIPNYTQGQTLIEALWKSVRLPWGANFLGDPLAAPYTLQNGQSAPVPTLTSVGPSSAAQGSTVSVTVTGSNFTSPAAISWQTPGISTSGITVVSSTTINATLVVSGNIFAGTYPVSVTTGGGTSGSLPFQVTAVPPTLTSISPSNGNPGASVPVTITGNYFTPATTLSSGSPALTFSNVAVASPSKITALVNIDSTATAQSASIRATTSAGSTNPVTFSVNNAQPRPPVLNSLSPASGAPGAVVDVVLTGTGFASGATVTLSGLGISVSAVSVVNSTQINAKFTIASGAAAGPRNVAVATALGTSSTVAFTVNSVSSAPTLTSVSPSSGTAGTTVAVTLTGTNFTSSASVRLSGVGAAVRNTTVVSPTRITVDFVLAPSTAKGAHNVYVTNSSGNSAILPFTVN